MQTKWEFHERQRKMPLTTSIFNNVLQSSGFSDAERLVREALQNSVDAHRSGSDEPVSVRIEKRELTGAEKMALTEALDLSGEPSNRQHLFKMPEGNALGTIADPHEPLTVLTISDFHTHGLPGKWDGTGDGDHFGRLVVNLGVDDKAEGAEISGGSFGFGKTVYGKASRIGVVAFYSVFEPSEATGGAHARFMATGLFTDHVFNGNGYDGFAFFGIPDPKHPQEALPFVDDDAHARAIKCGLPPRSKADHGTSILIVDCDQDVEAMKVAAETYWWPRLVQGSLDLAFVEDGREIWPRPKQNNDLLPFISCYQNLVSDHEEPPRCRLYSLNRINTTENGYKRPGTLSCFLLETESRYANTAALVRGPGMVVDYRRVGSDSFQRCVGLFLAHSDADKMLTYSEPQMHNEWDENADRLKRKFGSDGVKVVRGVSQRIERLFRDFQRLQEPPVPPGGLLPRELSKILGRFLDVPGKTPDPPSPSDPRPISIHVHEDRIKEGCDIWDKAEIVLELKDEYVDDTLECIVFAHHELLGDASLRVVERVECELMSHDGAILDKGSPSIAKILLKKMK